MGTTTAERRKIELLDYTTPRNKWELQRKGIIIYCIRNYTTPRNKWELQPSETISPEVENYTTPRKKWELQL